MNTRENEIQTTQSHAKTAAVKLAKSILLALAVGILVGILETIFVKGISVVTNIRLDHSKILIPLLPFAGLLITWLYYHFDRTSLKGMLLVFEISQRKRERIPITLVPLAIVSTWITHLCGGSVGREGVAVQIGATVSHTIAKKLNMPDNGRVMLVTGIAAGFAGVFGTPLAATFFAMEVIVSGILDYEALLPALIAAYSSCYTARLLGLHKFTFDLTDTLAMDAPGITRLILLGIIFGLTGWLFTFLMSHIKKFIKGKLTNPYIRIFTIAIPLAALLMLLHQGRYCGLGTALEEAVFFNGTVYSYDWILKMLLTIITLSIGFQGGEVTPLFVIGASLGYITGTILGIPPILTAALGYAAVFGSATNTLISPILISAEIFGAKNIELFVIVCVVAFIVSGDASIYSAQQKFKSDIC